MLDSMQRVLRSTQLCLSNHERPHTCVVRTVHSDPVVIENNDATSAYASMDFHAT